jgi:5-methylcytosine-specific restriction protein A
MTTYLFKWNPKRWAWPTLSEDANQLARKGFFDTSWSCGKTKRIQRGDRIFLLRTTVPPRGIVASGIVNEDVYVDTHYEAERDNQTALYVGVRFDAMLDPDRQEILAIDELPRGRLTEFLSKTQRTPASGITIPPPAALELEKAWEALLASHGQAPVSLAEEIRTPELFFEGAIRQICVNVYERHAGARQECVDHFGCRCSVCGFSFEEVFGELGLGFIHVHHLKALSDIREEYEINPVADLRPICPNCHAMIHRGAHTMTVDQLKALISRIAHCSKVSTQA